MVKKTHVYAVYADFSDGEGFCLHEGVVYQTHELANDRMKCLVESGWRIQKLEIRSLTFIKEDE